FAGQFEPPVNYFLNRSLNGIARGDFNGDGSIDLVVTGCGNPACTTTGAVFVLLGKGNGEFTRGGRFVAGPQGTDAIALTTGDFNRDGRPDLVVVNNDGLPDIVSADECGDDPACRDGTVSVLLGNGDGTFQPRLVFAEGIFPLSIAIADFDGDHQADLAIANPCGTDEACSSLGTVGIMLGNGDGT